MNAFYPSACTAAEEFNQSDDLFCHFLRAAISQHELKSNLGVFLCLILASGVITVLSYLLPLNQKTAWKNDYISKWNGYLGKKEQCLFDIKSKYVSLCCRSKKQFLLIHPSQEPSSTIQYCIAEHIVYLLRCSISVSIYGICSPTTLQIIDWPCQMVKFTNLIGIDFIT